MLAKLGWVYCLMLWYILSSATHDMRFFGKTSKPAFGWGTRRCKDEKNKQIISSIYDFDLIRETWNQNTKHWPTKEIRLIDNLVQCLKYFVKLKSLTKYEWSGSTS